MILPESCCPTTLQLAHSLEQSIAQLPCISSFSSAQINDEVKTTGSALLPSIDGSDRDSSAHVRSLCGWNIYSARDALSCRFGDDIQQDFAHLTCASPDSISLFILQSVDLTIRVQGKNHRFVVHFGKKTPSLTRARHRSAPTVLNRTSLSNWKLAPLYPDLTRVV